jgi:hypothetical protein
MFLKRSELINQVDFSGGVFKHGVTGADQFSRSNRFPLENEAFLSETMKATLVNLLSVFGVGFPAGCLFEESGDLKGSVDSVLFPNIETGIR